MHELRLRYFQGKSILEYCYTPLDGMPVHRRITPSSQLPVAIYTRSWKETMQGKVSCLRKQHDDRDQALNHQTSDLKSNHCTTMPRHPFRVHFQISVDHAYHFYLSHPPAPLCPRDHLQPLFQQKLSLVRVPQAPRQQETVQSLCFCQFIIMYKRRPH